MSSDMKGKGLSMEILFKWLDTCKLVQSSASAGWV